jgi:ABC-type Fe3+/spermidine/putrescine transport system ATPase subunit
VSCFIRQESILGNEQSKQSFQVKVTEASYQGQTEHYALQLPNGSVLRAVGFNPSAGPHAVGDTMTIQLPAEKIMVLKE